MAKKKRKKSDNSTNKILIFIASILAIIALILGSLIVLNYFGFEDKKEDIIVDKKEIVKEKNITKRDEPLKKDIIKIKKPLPIPKMKDKLKEVLKNQEKYDISASHEYADNKMKTPPAMAHRDIKLSPAKPQLAIIIDDVSVKSQVKEIKDVGLPLTMSFLPPSTARPNSAKLASKEKFYMVHLPMEAQHFNKEEPFTLRVTDTKDVILKRITELKKLFPKVKYINNHTGSKFTANEIAMNRLILVLNEQKISFIDSRTTAQTKAPKVLKNFGLKYMARDIFLDNKRDKKYIVNQIKKAIKVAKLHGTAIAIGHPHKNTLLAIKESKNLFKDVDLVYVYDLR